MSRGTQDPARALQIFVYRAITFYGLPFQAVQLTINVSRRGPTTPPGKPDGLGCSHFARRYFGNRFCFLFLRVLRCFSSPRSPLLPMYSVIDIPELPGMGFPIQKSPAQCLFSGSPKLIAANHVFHRHPAPRHPPSALSSLAINLAIPTITRSREIVLTHIQFSKSI